MKISKKILYFSLTGMTFFSLISCSNSSTTSTQDFSETITPNTVSSESSNIPIQKEKFFVTFVLNTDSPDDFFIKEIEKNQKIEVSTIPTRANDDKYSYEFDNWYIDQDLTQIYDFNNEVTDSFVLYAKWTKKSLKVQEDTPVFSDEIILHQIKNDDETIKYNLYFVIGFNQSNFDISYSYNTETDMISFEEIKLTGYNFEGWYLDVNMINEPFDNANTTLASLNKDTIYLYAKFVEKTQTPPIEEQCVHQVETKILQQGSCKTGTKTIEQTYCVKCGEIYDTKEYLVSHEFTDASEYVYYAPTCTEEGYYIQKCKNCNLELRFIYADKTEHTFQEKVVTEPTCLSIGYKAMVCSFCGASKDYQEIESLGHNYYSIGVVTSTCSAHGYEMFKCMNCGDKYNSDPLPLDENNHVYDENGICSCGHQREE